MVDEAIGVVTMAVEKCLEFCMRLFDATGTTSLWVTGIAFFAIVSIILLPLRGGRGITLGGFTGFLANKINGHKKSDNTKKGG